MPTYVYETITANGRPGRRFEVEQRMRDPALERDPKSGLPVRRVISGGLGFLAKVESEPHPCACAGGDCDLMSQGGGCCGGGCAGMHG